MAHRLVEVRSRREVLSSGKDQHPDRAVPGHPVHELGETGDFRDAKGVQPVRAPEPYDGDAVRPDLEVDPVHSRPLPLGRPQENILFPLSFSPLEGFPRGGDSPRGENGVAGMYFFTSFVGNP